MKIKLLLLLLLLSGLTKAQGFRAIKKADSTGRSKYLAVYYNPAGGDTLLALDTARYYLTFTDTFYGLAITGLYSKPGWWAVNQNHKVLFQIYNTSYGDMSPDEFNEGLIRIIDDKLNIGFANRWGNIVIPCQFPVVSKFQNGYAIFGDDCEPVRLNHPNEENCRHFSFNCTKHGILNKDGKVLLHGDYTYEQLEEKIKKGEIR